MTRVARPVVLIVLSILATTMVGGCGDAEKTAPVSKTQYSTKVTALLAREQVIMGPINAAAKGMDESVDVNELIARCAQIRAAGVRARPQVAELSTEMAAVVPPVKVRQLHNRLVSQYRIQEWDRAVSTIGAFCSSLGTQDAKTIDDAAWALEQYNENNDKLATQLEASFKHDGYSFDLTPE